MMKQFEQKVNELVKATGMSPDKASDVVLAMMGMNFNNSAQQSVETPVEKPAPKYYRVAKKEVVWERDGRVCSPSYAGGNADKDASVRSADTASAIWYVNDRRIKDAFGDDVEWKQGGKFKTGYHCKDDATLKKLLKFELVQGVTVDEWNAWADYKYEKIMKEAERYLDIKVK